MRYPKPSSVGVALYNPATEQYEVAEMAHAYQDDDPIVLAHPAHFGRQPIPTRPGYGRTVTAGSRTRQSVKTEDPYSDIPA